MGEKSKYREEVVVGKSKRVEVEAEAKSKCMVGEEI